jgi:hypothetical protein
MIYLFTFLIFIFGLILGFYFNFPFGKFIKTLLSKGNSTINEQQYFNKIEKSIISFRNKGMPTNTKEQCMPWVYVNNKGKECGSIHVRLANH